MRDARSGVLYETGFGTRMMSIVLGGAGQVEFDYRPEGLRCVVTITG